MAVRPVAVHPEAIAEAADLKDLAAQLSVRQFDQHFLR